MYFIATGAMAISGLFTVPMLVRLLGENEFGRWSLVEPVLVVGAPLSLLGASWGVVKQIAHDSVPPGLACRRLIMAGQPVMIFVAVLTTSVLVAMGFSAADGLRLGATVWLEGILVLEVAALRAANMATAFMFTQVIRAVALVGLMVGAMYTWVVVSRVGDVIQIRLLVAAVAGGIGAALLFIQGASSIDADVTPGQIGANGRQRASSSAFYGDAVRYGAPLLAVSLLGMVLQFADRFIIKAFLDYRALAHYFVYIKISSVIALLVVTPFALWWPAKRFKQRKAPDGGRDYFPRVAMIFLVVLLAGAGSLWLVTGLLLPFFAPGIPFDSVVVLLLLLGGVAAGMAYPLNVALLDEGQTHKNLYAAFLAAVLNVILAFILIPKLQLIGAALANLLGYVVYVISFTYFSQRVFRVSFAFGRMLALTCVAVASLCGVATIIPFEPGPSSVRRVVIYLGVLSIVSPLLGVRLRGGA